jgi:hypothetical protein
MKILIKIKDYFYNLLILHNNIPTITLNNNKVMIAQKIILLINLNLT